MFKEFLHRTLMDIVHLGQPIATYTIEVLYTDICTTEQVGQSLLNISCIHFHDDYIRGFAFPLN